VLPPSRTDRLRNLLLLLRRGVGLPKEPFLPSPAVEVHAARRPPVFLRWDEARMICTINHTTS
jgi:hypothetical protein